MPLDPQARAMLDLLAEEGIPPNHQLPVEDARYVMRLRAKRFAGEPVPVARVEDRTVPGPGGEIPVRVYTPEGTGPFPCLVYFHGGGWVIGSIETHDHVARPLAARTPCVVVSVEYRLAPEHKFPAAAEDAYAATQWVAANAASLNVDATRIAVGGDSAGGNLATVTCLMARERGGPRLVFQLLYYPVTGHDFETASYLENANIGGLTRADMIWFWNHYLARKEDALNPYATPLRAEDLRGLPPALIMAAEYDPLRDEDAAYAERLRRAGVPVRYVCYEGMIHGFISRASVLDQGKKGLEESVAALQEAFGLK